VAINVSFEVIAEGCKHVAEGGEFLNSQRYTLPRFDRQRIGRVGGPDLDLLRA
jgi:hypothetical protein